MIPKRHPSIPVPLLLGVLAASVVQTQAQSTAPDRFKQFD